MPSASAERPIATSRAARSSPGSASATPWRSASARRMRAMPSSFLPCSIRMSPIWRSVMPSWRRQRGSSGVSLSFFSASASESMAPACAVPRSPVTRLRSVNWLSTGTYTLTASTPAGWRRMKSSRSVRRVANCASASVSLPAFGWPRVYRMAAL
ncbi:hypothetical protein [Massilia glaciei]|uniref:Uncharacterized protein n=1 Tax=Massilia glaciei TaxID=1524097 RepID=A0A2U2HNJ8_9BURK|nr:hypothetical protein C7C56_008495 [Massilia glaciei]